MEQARQESFFKLMEYKGLMMSELASYYSLLSLIAQELLKDEKISSERVKELPCFLDTIYERSKIYDSKIWSFSASQEKKIFENSLWKEIQFLYLHIEFEELQSDNLAWNTYFIWGIKKHYVTLFRIQHSLFSLVGKKNWWPTL